MLDHSQRLAHLRLPWILQLMHETAETLLDSRHKPKPTGIINRSRAISIATAATRLNTPSTTSMAAGPMRRIQHIHDGGRSSSALPIAESMLTALHNNNQTRSFCCGFCSAGASCSYSQGSVLVHSQLAGWSQVQDCQMHKSM